MTDLSQTAASVLPSAGVATVGLAAVAITAGEALYADSTTSPPGQLKLAQATTAAKAACVGIAINSAAAGQPVSYNSTGSVTVGATVAVGTVYVVAADNPGAIAPNADLTTTNYVTILGVADTTTTIALNIQRTGIIHA